MSRRRASHAPETDGASFPRESGGLKALATFLVGSTAIGIAMFVGCNSESAGNPGAASTSGQFTTGTMSNAACHGSFPDGQCEVFAQDPESCECQDCVSLATCNSRCQDDGQCNLAVGTAEDCSCKDCEFNGACIQTFYECDYLDPDFPEDYDPSCNTYEACVCPDCSGEAACGCDNNGACNPSVENCACGDCSGTEHCGGGPGPASSSASNGGAGGNGNGGATASSAAMSSAQSSAQSSAAMSSANAGGAGGN